MKIILFVAAICIVFTAQALEHNDVKFVAVLFRHGDRMPVDCYPSDPYKNQSLWPALFGQLTNTGKKQHFKLGKYLRWRYSHLLGEVYNPKQVLVQSTDVDRTLMSAEANLAGLFPPTGKQIWDSEMPWQPIPVHTRPEYLDEVLAMKRPCPRYNAEKDKYLASLPYINIVQKHKKLMSYLSKYVGMEVEDFTEVMLIYSCLNIEHLYNFELPAWSKTVFPEPLHIAAGLSFAVSAATPAMARLIAGPLVQEITRSMKDVIDGSPRRFMMYSGHDFTVGTLLTALGVFDDVCPEYTATVFMELIEADNATSGEPAWYVRLLYRNSVDLSVKPVVLAVPGCGDLCPFQQFVRIYENLISVDWERECNLNHVGRGMISTYKTLGAVLFGVGVFTLVWQMRRRKITVIVKRPVALRPMETFTFEEGRKEKVFSVPTEDAILQQNVPLAQSISQDHE